jgi:signal transduction histidine kinase
MDMAFDISRASETARAYLRQRRRLMGRYFLAVRLLIGLGVAGYLAIDAMMSPEVLEAPLAVVSYLLANVGIWLVCQTREDCRHTRWLFVGLDLTYVLLIRNFFAFEVLAGPNVTMAGILALALVAYTFYSDPRLTASLVFVSMLAVGASLWAEAAQATGGFSQHYLRATLLMGYLAAFGLVSLGLALFTRQQTLNFLREQQERIEASMEAAVERGRSEHLSELNHLKEEFITVLSHELRTPISPLRSSLELLEEDLKGQPDALDTLDLAREATHQLQHLALDYAQLAEVLTRRDDHNASQPLNVRLASLVDVLVKNRDAAKRTRRKGLDELAVIADPYLLGGALTALLRRADLLTPDDQRFTVRGHADDSEERVVLEVNDPGNEIDDAINDQLDDPFSFSEERAYYTPNSGLELILAHHAIEQLGGALRVESAPGEGTTVVCSLPAARPDAEWLDDDQLHFQSGVLRTA